ncbi:GNAT family N-acetyltransferase [Streptomyces yunnanensis]|uniref:GNAT family N-acetyltransferase n=1 Tax=Streptomyces yunnanensis TaxID=156453 RepID=A0ABY8AIB5_9ACTN|nr:GNAT family N-acetyltransferase [Streptomyces yunnanensis]WEB44509.1 GNAT family N-acetyltransferase [Streptomyces yunnanensis]
MIEVFPSQLPHCADWFVDGPPGAAALAEHALITGTGRWWTDRVHAPRAVAVSCADHVLFRGDPTALAPLSLAGFAAHYAQAPDRFLPLLGSSFDLLVPWERMVYLQREPLPASRPPRGVKVRRLHPQDAEAVRALGAEAAWIHASWGGPAGLAASGHGWAAFQEGRVVAVACTYFRGTRYEDVACVTLPEHRRQRLALACVTALCRDIAARGHIPSWTCSRDNRPSRLLAWTAGFRLADEYVHHATGQPVRHTAGLVA